MLLSVLLALPALPAWAASHEDKPAATAEQAGGAQDGEESGPGSVAEALVRLWAERSGMSLDDFLAANSDEVASFLGDPGAAPALRSGLDPSLFGDFLSASGLTLDFDGIGNVDQLWKRLAERAATVDGYVTLAAADYAKRLGQMAVPELTLPETPRIDGFNPGLGVEHLTFGLFADKTIANLLSDSPDVLSAVENGQLTDPEARKAFDEAMLKAGAQTESVLSRLPLPCVSSMVAAMATGEAVDDPDCGGGGPGQAAANPCVVAGLYLRDRIAGLLDPSFGLGPANAGDPIADPNSDLLTLFTDPSRRLTLKDSLADALSPGLGSTGECLDAKEKTGAVLRRALPDVVSGLRPAIPEDQPGGGRLDSGRLADAYRDLSSRVPEADRGGGLFGWVKRTLLDFIGLGGVGDADRLPD